MSPAPRVPGWSSSPPESPPLTLRSTQRERATLLPPPSVAPPASEAVVERSGIVAAVSDRRARRGFPEDLWPGDDLPWLEAALLEEDAVSARGPHDTDQDDLRADERFAADHDTIPEPAEDGATDPPPTLPAA